MLPTEKAELAETEFGAEGMDPSAPLATPGDGVRPVTEDASVYYLYGCKPGLPKKLVATFGSEAQLLAYVRWATLETSADGTLKFEQATPLATYRGFDIGTTPLTSDAAEDVPHNPSPSML